MAHTILTRRRLVGLLGFGAAGGVLAACGPSATPTTAPTKPPEAPKPAAATTASTPVAPTSAPTGTAPAKPTETTKPAGAASPAAAAKPQGVGFVKGPLDGEAKALNGAGATFPAALYSRWHEEFF